MVNLLRFDAGSPIYGDVSLILSPSSAARTSLVSPFDTGSWNAMCNSSSWLPLKPHYPHNCSAYGGHAALATLNHTAHALLANEVYWKSPRALLAKLARIFSPLASPAPIAGEDLPRYLEAVPAATLRYPADIRFVVADFSSLFGSAIGAELQRWCVRQGWPFTWSLGLNLGPMTMPRFWSVGKLKGAYGTEPYARLLDPTVGVGIGVNASVTSADKQAFASAWAAAASARGPAAADWTVSFTSSADSLEAAAVTDSVDWAARWSALRNQTGRALHLSALRAGACADIERCIGVSAAGDECVCY